MPKYTVRVNRTWCETHVVEAKDLDDAQELAERLADEGEIGGATIEDNTLYEGGDVVEVVPYGDV